MSHTLKNLNTKLGSKPPKEQEIPPLIHGAGSNDVSGRQDRLEQLALRVVDYFLHGIDGKYSGDKTCESNRILGIPQDSLYCYFGHLYPFDDQAAYYFVFSHKNIDMASVVPFDSGGIAWEKVSLDWETIGAGKSKKAQKKDYYQTHKCDIKDCEQYFNAFIELFFGGKVDNYLYKLPNMPIDNFTCNATSDFRNWVFESQIQSKVLMKDVRPYISKEFETVLLETDTESIAGDVAKKQFLKMSIVCSSPDKRVKSELMAV